MVLSVLVVDDEPAVRENLSAYMEDEGMAVSEAESGEQAVELARDGGLFQVCVMDLRLPGMDGNAAILALHALQPKLRFLVHTGSTHYVLPPSLRAIGMSEGDVFMKPLADMSLLADAIREAARA
jgi:two-component system OmpR family response regulator